MHDYTKRPNKQYRFQKETYTFMATHFVGKVALKNSGVGIVFTTNETFSNWIFLKIKRIF